MTEVEKPSYVIKAFMRHYHFRDDQNLGQGIFYVGRIPRSCHNYKYLITPWDLKIKDACNQLR